MRLLMPFTAAALLALAGCTVVPDQHDPAPAGLAVSVVNSLTWPDAMKDRPDSLRTAWPLRGGVAHTEQFPLVQVKRCDAAGACSWGVAKAQRTISGARHVANGIALEVELALDVDRRHEMRQGAEMLVLAIPADVPALSAKRTVRKSLVLTYGKVERIALDFGIGYNICAQRLDTGGQPVDACAIPHM